MSELSEWVIEEIAGAEFGDQRLTKRYGLLLESLSSAPDSSIPQAFKSWGETLAAYRFFGQDKVNPEQIIAAHREATLNRIQQESLILIVQDTTEINYSHRKPMPGMGPLNYESLQGCYLHPSIALTPNRVCLGVVEGKLWSRESLGKKALREHRPIEEKESYRWLEGYARANEVAKACPHTQVISVADREADIYELMQQREKGGYLAHWLLRAEYDRLVYGEEDKPYKERLWTRVKAAPKVGQITFTLPRAPASRGGKVIGEKRPKRPERPIVQDVRVAHVRLVPPKRRISTSLMPINVYAVYCCEVQPPEGEKPIEWLLLTSVPVEQPEQARDIIRWYLCRWQIEVFFKLLKSGCKIEKLQLDNFSNTANCIALYMVVAWRILYLTMMGRQCPELACDKVFDDCEWQSVYTLVSGQTPPATPPPLNTMIRLIASLGGFLGRKQDGEPGPKALWVGMQRMRDFAWAWQVFRK